MNAESRSTQVDRPERPAPVAPTRGTLTAGESVPLYYKIIDLITLLSAGESVLINPKKRVEELLSFAESVGYSKSRRAVLGHLLLSRADSPGVIRVQTGLLEPCVYRAIDALLELGYLVWAVPQASTGSVRGIPPA